MENEVKDETINSNLFSDYVETPTNDIGEMISLPQEELPSLTENISNNISNMGDNIANGFNSITEPIVEATQTITEPIVDSVSNTIQTLDSATEGIIENTMDTIRSKQNILFIMVGSILSNSFRVFLVAGIILLFMILLTTKSVLKPKKKEKEKERINLVLKEGLTNREKVELLKSMKKGFCKVNTGDTNKLNNQCKKLTKNVCNMTECCVYAKTGNKESCMAGDSMGPTYQHDDKDKKINFDYYYYMGKCKGKCP